MKMKKVMMTLFALALVSGAEAQSKFASARSLLVKQQKEAATQQSRRAGSQEEQLVECFIKFNAPCEEELKALGVQPQVVMDELMTAQVPVSMLDKVAQLEQVTSMEISQQPQLFTDKARESTGAGKVLHGLSNGLKQDYDGKGVVMCVIDGGIDFQHPALRTADGHSRCSMVYFANRKYVEGKGGQQPVVDGRTLPGVLYTKQEEIDTLTCDDFTSHGTHTISTAAGREIGEYGGVAPGTDLVVCSVTGTTGSTATVNSMALAAQYAKNQGKRAVISRSIGELVGPHDGTSMISLADKNMAENNNIIICQSSANAGSDNIYIHFKKDSLETINIGGVPRKYYAMMVGPLPSDCKDNTTVQMYADAWASDNQPFDIGFVSFNGPTLELEFVSSIGFVKYEDNLDKNGIFRSSCYVQKEGVNTDSLRVAGAVSKENQKYNMAMAWNLRTNKDASYFATTPQMGIMIFPRNENQEIHVWVSTFNSTAINAARDLPSTLKNPQNIKLMCGNSDISCCDDAASPYVISVGNYTSKTRFLALDGQEKQVVGAVLDKISPSSSYGTALNGVQTPTVCGPGTIVVSAVNHNDPTYCNDNIGTKKVTENGVTYYWTGMTGTSMSCPHVAGIMAQWLQANKDLTLQQIKNVLKETSSPCADTDPDKLRWGQYGRIDAMKGIQYILNTTDIRDLQAEKALYVKGDVYNMKGQLVRTGVTMSEGLNGLPAGIYVVNGRKVVVK